MIGSIGYFEGEDMDDKLMLISLIARLYTSYHKVKKGNMLDMMRAICPSEEDQFNIFLSNLCDVTTELMYGCTKIDNCGYNTSKEAITKIKELISKWIPF